jgi:integrase/recombinase XerD
MSRPDAQLDDYLRLRRALGYRLEREEVWLRDLLAHMRAAGSDTLTSDLAISWARLPATAQPRYWALRLGCARKFAAYLHSIDSSHQIPPSGVFPAPRHRPMPYLWTAEQIELLLNIAGQLRPPLRGLTYQTLFGLLAVSGMRLGEAIGLHHGDVDLDDAVITIRHAKFDRPRIVPWIRRPSLRCITTPSNAIGYVPSGMQTRSWCPVVATHSAAARQTRRCGRSPPRWASAPRPSVRAHMTSGTVWLFTP